jgi:DNA damage-binding protein 1
VIFLDQASLAIEASYDLDLYEAAMSICSCFLRDSSHEGDPTEYVVVGTAFVLPEEPQPSRGRLLVFELLSEATGQVGRKVRLVVETPTRGAAFSLASLNGKLVAGIDSKVGSPHEAELSRASHLSRRSRSIASPSPEKTGEALRR